MKCIAEKLTLSRWNINKYPTQVALKAFGLVPCLDLTYTVSGSPSVVILETSTELTVAWKSHNNF